MVEYSYAGGSELFVFLFLGSVLISWLVVFTAVYVATLRLRPSAEPRFSARGRRTGDGADLELRNIGGAPALGLTVGWDVEHPEAHVATIDPGEVLAWHAANLPAGKSEDDIHWLDLTTVTPRRGGNWLRSWRVPVCLPAIAATDEG